MPEPNQYQVIAHILASIRYCQENDVALEQMPHFVIAEEVPLNDDQIDELCEVLSLGTTEGSDGS